MIFASIILELHLEHFGVIILELHLEHFGVGSKENFFKKRIELAISDSLFCWDKDYKKLMAYVIVFDEIC